jgi:uncharacterized protein YbjT (DUF2867 family)
MPVFFSIAFSQGLVCSSLINLQIKMSLPTVAIVGASGYIGKCVTEEGLLKAFALNRFKEIRVLSTKRSETIEHFEKQGAKAYIVDFANVSTLVEAFTGVDVVVSCLGTKGEGVKASKNAILDALVQAGVKVYFPSEFGTNHYSRVKNYEHEVFEEKKKHFSEAQSKGIKTVAILCSDIMESTFGPWFGFDNKAEVWKIIGSGNVPVAVTAERDLANFTVEAALLAFKDPEGTPDFIECFSDMKTLREYAEQFDKVAGRVTKLEFTTVDQALTYYEAENRPFEYILQILFEEGAYNYTDCEGNELLNPGENIWKLRKITEYASETGGRP